MIGKGWEGSQPDFRRMYKKGQKQRETFRGGDLEQEGRGQIKGTLGVMKKKRKKDNASKIRPSCGKSLSSLGGGVRGGEEKEERALREKRTV